MICGLMLDLDDAPDFPGNGGAALGRPLAAYPFMAARGTGRVQSCFVVTSSPPVKAIGLQHNAVIVDPPGGGAPDAERLLRHGFQFILEELREEKARLELVAVFFSNAPALTGALLDKGIDALQSTPALDGALSVSPYNRWNPSFARQEDASGLLEPYAAGAEARGDAWYPDWGVQLLRPRCLEASAPRGQQPFPWLGKSVLPLKQWGGGPVDYQWQIPSLEYWLKKHGFSDLSGGLELQPQPKLQPKSDRR